jgi:hypothetical protein
MLVLQPPSSASVKSKSRGSFSFVEVAHSGLPFGSAALLLLGGRVSDTEGNQKGSNDFPM